LRDDKRKFEDRIKSKKGVDDVKDWEDLFKTRALMDTMFEEKQELITKMHNMT